MERNDIVSLALDVYRGTGEQAKFDKRESSEVLRQALIAANGGSSELNYKTLRRNKCEIFEIIEEVIPVLVQEGLSGDEFFMNLVEERRVDLGDDIDFVVDKNNSFIVSEIANGIATPRRQRIPEKTTVNVPTSVHAIRFYDELSRVMAGRVDWNHFIDAVARSYRDKLYTDVYGALSGITAATAGLNSNYVVSGSYSEATLLNLVEHVEAATGKSASIIGSKAALRKCTSAVQSDEANSDYYNAGFYGKLAGVPMISVRQKHAVGTDNFVFPENKLFVIASDDRPIKCVFKGDAIIKENDGMTNADMSMEYLYMENYGVGLVVNDKLGVYTIS